MFFSRIRCLFLHSSNFQLPQTLKFNKLRDTYWNDATSTFNYGPDSYKMIHFFVLRLILCSAWFGAISTVGIAFFSLSNKEQRRSNLFRLQCVCVVFTILYNASEAGNMMYRLKSLTFHSDQKLNYPLYSIWRNFGQFGEHIIPTLSDSALLFRISSFFPFPVYSKRSRLLIFSPFWISLLCRGILSILVFVFILVQWLTNKEIFPIDEMLVNVSPIWSINGYEATVILELSMGSLYCIIASAILLFKAHQLANARIISHNKAKINTRMRFFAEALLMCCIPPTLLNIAAPIQLMKRPPSYFFFREIGSLLVNITVIFNILATSWSSIRTDWSNNQSHKGERSILLLERKTSSNLEGGIKADK